MNKKLIMQQLAAYVKDIRTWAGTSASLEHLLDAVAHKASFDDDEDDSNAEDMPMPPVQFGMDGRVAIITISGTLVYGSMPGWIMDYYGIIGYDNIRSAASWAVNNNAESIVFHWDSGGGDARGVGDLNDFISGLPVNTYSYTDSTVASACLWLATAANEFWAHRSAREGSIGCIAVTFEITEQLKSEGITAEVFKSAPLKGYGNRFEKLTQAAKDEIQKEVDGYGNQFNLALGRNIGAPPEYVKEKLATGQMWFSEEAMQLGLITGIKTFDELLSSLDNTPNQNIDRGTPTMLKKSSLFAHAQTGTTAVEYPVDNTVLEAEPPATVPTPATENAAPIADSSLTAEPPPVPAASASDLIAKLESLLDANAQLKTELAQAKAAVSGSAALRQVVEKCVTGNYVRLGITPPSSEMLSAMDSAMLVVQFESSQSQLTAKYGLGGQHAQSSGQTDDTALSAAAIALNKVYQQLAAFNPK